MRNLSLVLLYCTRLSKSCTVGFCFTTSPKHHYTLLLHFHTTTLHFTSPQNKNIPNEESLHLTLLYQLVPWVGCCFDFYSTKHFLLPLLPPKQRTWALTFTLLNTSYYYSYYYHYYYYYYFRPNKGLDSQMRGGGALHQWPPHLTAAATRGFSCHFK